MIYAVLFAVAVIVVWVVAYVRRQSDAPPPPPSSHPRPGTPRRPRPPVE